MLHRVLVVAAVSILIALAGGCTDDTFLGGSADGRETLFFSPNCGSDDFDTDQVFDEWKFDVDVQDRVVIFADTVNVLTAADLCFDRAHCKRREFDGDDEVPCTFPPPDGTECPRANFKITGKAGNIKTCRLRMKICSEDCAEPKFADYQLSVTADDDLGDEIPPRDILLELVRNDGSPASSTTTTTIAGTSTSTSTSSSSTTSTTFPD